MFDFNSSVLITSAITISASLIAWNQLLINEVREDSTETGYDDETKWLDQDACSVLLSIIDTIIPNISEPIDTRSMHTSLLDLDIDKHIYEEIKDISF